jgi:hypothetical protein
MPAHFPHAVVIAAIFGPYLILMITLGIYIWNSGRSRHDHDEDTEREADPGPAVLPAAA